MKKRMRRNNRIRAGWALAAVTTFAETTGMDGAGEDEATILGDLLANLMHFCDARGLDFADRLETARMHYDAEQIAAQDSWNLNAHTAGLMDVLDGYVKRVSA